MHTNRTDHFVLCFICMVLFAIPMGTIVLEGHAVKHAVHNAQVASR